MLPIDVARTVARRQSSCWSFDRYINTSAITVDEGFSAERTYILLRTLGLRHVTVVDRC